MSLHPRVHPQRGCCPGAARDKFGNKQLGMKDILEFIVAHCAFLYESAGFRFVHSVYSSSFGGSACIVMASEHLRLRFVYDCGQLSLELQGVHERGENHWYAIEVVEQLVTGRPVPSSELTPGRARFLSEHLDAVRARFVRQELAETRVALRKIGRRTRATR
jgi:hypothetical protein